jgi:hypothetical protein
MYSTLSLNWSPIFILWIMNNLPSINKLILLYWNIFNFFDFSFNRNNFYLFLWNDLFVILSNFLYGIKILFDHFSWNCLNNFSLLIIHYFSSFWDHLCICACLIINYFFLIWNIFNSTLPYNNVNLYL